MDGDPFDLVGDVLDGQFRVDEFAGEGDLSVVYRGHHIGVDATVAIKCLNLPATLDQALVKPLVETFREASRLHYKLARGNMNIAQSIAAGQTIAPRTGSTVPYLVREWFDGESLSTELARRRAEGKHGRPLDETIALLDPAVDGMAFAHAHDVVHLSFSPSNLFLAEADGKRTLKVLDFGVARAMNELHADLPPGSRPPAGLRVLFPAYAAPEQLDKGVGDVGAPTDVYALALVVMELLQDRVVMEGSETGVLVDRALDLNKRPTPQSRGIRVSKRVESVLARAVSRSPDARQKNAAAFWADLKSAFKNTESRAGMAAMRAPAPTLMGVAPSANTMRPAASATTGTDATTSPEVLPVSAPAAMLAGSLAPAATATLPPTSGATNGAAMAAAPATAEPEAPAPLIRTAPLPPPLAAPSAPRQPAWIPTSTETAPAIVTPHPALATPVPSGEHRIAGLPVGGLSRRFVAATSAVAASLVICLVVLLVTWPRSRAATKSAPIPTLPARGPAATAATATVPPSATTLAPDTPSATTTPPSTARESAAPPAPVSGPRFSLLAAQRGFLATSHETARCKRSTMWGVAKASVTFANDGSVDHVLIGPPFTGTATGACVGDVLRTVHVPPFGGAPVTYITQFYVAPQ
jgi:serine/threonine-protein kinase